MGRPMFAATKLLDSSAVPAEGSAVIFDLDDVVG